MVPDATTRADGATDSVVALRSVVVAFGGLLALGGIDLDVARGDRLAILGPNGAGKTTLFNVVAGDLVPRDGSVTIKGVDCTHLPSRHRPRLGVARTYQKARSFPGLSVGDNLYLAIVGRHGRHHAVLPRGGDQGWRQRAVAAAESVWLHERIDTVVGDLSHGQKRQLEIAMCLATEPQVLLLDEPLAGMGPEETERMLALLAELKPHHAILLVEHDMDAVFRVSDEITVMVNGTAIATGSPALIRENPEVQKAYLGEADAH